jgi:hypothetical protein
MHLEMLPWPKDAHIGEKYAIPSGGHLALRHFLLASYRGQDSVGRWLNRLETMDLVTSASTCRAGTVVCIP